VVRTIDLDGTWQLQKVGDRKSIGAEVPGDVYKALLAAKKIPDPYYRDNENQVQWVGESDWVFRRTFQVPAALLENKRVLLHCDGLDTFATIRINGKKVAATDNMFRTWEWEVRKLLKAGKNEVEVLFASVLPYVRNKQKERHLHYWGDSITAGPFAWVRKQQCNFGWDWGIKAVTCGIWRGIRLVAFDTARLSDVLIVQEHADGQVNLALSAQADVVAAAGLQARVTVLYKGQVVAQSQVNVRKNGAVTANLKIEDPQLWWPLNMGRQPLYDIKVELIGEAGKVVDVQSRRIGLRTLKLDRHKDAWGESFQFVVNGVPYFAKGANWIPDDGILSRMTPARYRQRVADAAAANMNMLRVWGGGLYEDDAFYDACDEMGITIWQDFMFACSAYPCSDAEFRASVEAEARDNVKRMRHHPCIAFWCGNNEVEQALGTDKRFERSMSWKEYAKIFDQVLPKVIRQVDPQRDYWPSSPHSPKGDRKDFNNPTCGDAHLWAVWHGGQPFEWYRTCEHRFNSEFGFQSFPEPKTVYGYTAPQDRNITSPVMEHHQRSGIGNTTIMRYMLDWFRLPSSFEMTIWASQVLQGMAMKYACEHWRHSMPRGMGTLYWQINDTWPVASWSSIDYHGRWKALHYMARHFFAPLLVSGVEDKAKGTVQIHVNSDLLQPIAATLRWRICTVAGKTVGKGSKTIRAAKLASRSVHALDLADDLAKYGPQDLLVHLELSAKGQPTSTNLVTFARPKQMELASKPGITAQVQADGKQGFAVTLETKSPALWTWLELAKADATYSDNFVHVLPGQKAKILVRPKKSLTLKEFRDQLTVRSLVDTYA
jgi:beta-mannosidase